jgi:hypothetical protein
MFKLNLVAPAATVQDRNSPNLSADQSCPLEPAISVQRVIHKKRRKSRLITGRFVHCCCRDVEIRHIVEACQAVSNR